MMGPLVLSLEVVWRPVIGPVQIIALAAVLAALAAAAHLRLWRPQPLRAAALLLMRLAVIAALALLLMGPSVLPPRSAEPAKAKLDVLLDTSGSMLTADGDPIRGTLRMGTDAAGRSRLAYLLENHLSPEQVRRLGERFDLRLLGFDEAMRTLPPAALRQAPDALARGRATRYADALTEALLDVPAEGGDAHEMLVLGDGRDTDDAPLMAAITLAKQRGVTVHTVAVGSEASPPDLALAAFPQQEFLFAGETGRIVVRLQQAGLEGQTAALRLNGGGADEQRQVRLGSRPATIELPIEPEEPGLHEYSVSVDPLDGEAVTENNRHTVFVEVAGQRIRVLLLEGQPYWDTKFLAQSLRLDPRIELVQITRVSAQKLEGIVTRAEEDAPAEVPRTVEQFARHDVVILGRGLENLLSPEAAAALERYVDRSGGRLILARGRPYDPMTAEGRALATALRPLEPVIWGRGAMRDMPIALTPAGRGAPPFALAAVAADADELVASLPPLSSVADVRQMKPLTVMLAHVGATPSTSSQPASQRPPAIVMMNHGRGRVFAVLGEGLWRWGFLPPRLSEYQGAFDAFWSNTVRWLAMGTGFQPGERVALELSRSSLRLGDPLLIDLATRFAPPAGFAPQIALIDPDGHRESVSLDPLPGAQTRFRASVEPDRTGAWRIVLDAAPLTDAPVERRFSVYDLNVEQLRTAARPEVLRDLAGQTGGLFLRAEDGDGADLAELLHRHRAAKIVPPASRYIWDRGLFLAVLLLWAGLEWIGRRSAGWL